MPVDPATEARVFGKLALRGVLSREDVESLFDEVRRGAREGRGVGLGELAVQRGLIDQAALILYMGADGEDVPELPGYRYRGKLGEGGTACVFRVERADGSLEALKILSREMAARPTEVRAFLDEAALLKSLDHPNVVRGHRAGRFAGHYLSFMDHVDGRTLAELISQGGAFDEDGALVVILQVARALDYLRGHGVVHRDIKPGNIMVTEDRTVKLIDLGFAAERGADEGSEETTRGTAAFLSPEQARGQADLDVRSDIYSLGATLYQMVLGELPFEGDDEELVQKAVLAGLSAEATKGGRISQHMHYFIEKMMAKDREVRYQDPAELTADIERQIEGKKTAQASDGADQDAEHEQLLRRRADRLRRKRMRRRRP